MMEDLLAIVAQRDNLSQDMIIQAMNKLRRD